MRLFLFLFIICLVAGSCQRRSSLTLSPQQHIQFTFIDLDGSSTAYTSDSLGFFEIQTYPNFIYPVEAGAEHVNLSVTTSFYMGEDEQGIPYYVQLQMYQHTIPVELLQPNAEGQYYIFAEPQDWVDRLFNNDVLAAENTYHFVMSIEEHALQGMTSPTNDDYYFTLTESKITPGPNGEIYLQVSGQFHLLANNWYPVEGIGPWKMENGTFTFTVDLSYLY